MIGKPGSLAWLLGHEIRMTWRNAGARRRTRAGPTARLVLIGVFFAIVLGAAGAPLAIVLRHVQIEAGPVPAAIANLACALFFTLMLSQTLIAAIEALYERGDLDLMFSSPVSPRRVMTVRFLTVAAGLMGAFGFLIAGLILPSIIMGHWRWLGVFVVLAALALAASAAGTALAMGLFRLIGPRRTRTVGQLTAAAAGASFFLLSQIREPGAGRSSSLWRDAMRYAAREDLRLPPGFDWPIRAMLGEPLPMLAMLGGGAALFLIVNGWLGRRFAADAAAAKGSGASRSRGRTIETFAAGAWAATVRKELRLLARDAALMSQVLLRVLYLLPVAFILARNAGASAQMTLAGGVAALSMLSGQVAASLTWITVSAEDAPELLAASPTPLATLHRAKLTAALLPLAVLLAIPLSLLIAQAPLAGVAAMAGAAGCALTAGLINIWRQRPGKRSEFRRRSTLPWYVTLAIAVTTGLIATAAFLATLGSFWALLPLLPAAAILLALRRDDDAIARILRGEA